MLLKDVHTQGKATNKSKEVITTKVTVLGRGTERSKKDTTGKGHTGVSEMLSLF